MDLNPPPTRRGLLEILIGLCSLITGLAMAIPGMMYLWPAAKGGGADRVEVEGANQMTPGQSETIQVGSRVVIVVRTRSGFDAFSAVCTHLGCLVTWDTAKKEFLCPCHAAVFGSDGSVVSGPPPAPLERYVVKDIAGKVFVSPPMS